MTPEAWGMLALGTGLAALSARSAWAAARAVRGWARREVGWRAGTGIGRPEGIGRPISNDILPPPETLEYRAITDLARYRAMRNLKMSEYQGW